MDTSDDRRTVPIPTFRQPRALLDPPPEGIPTTTTVVNGPPAFEMTVGGPAPLGDLYGPPNPRPETNGTRTATSDSTGDKAPKPSVRDTAKLAAGLLGIVLAGAAWVVRLRRGAQLRRPTRQELDDIAAPLASLAVRHLPAGILNADLADITAAAAATGNYISAGPLIEPVYEDPGLPDDLNGEPLP